MIRCVILGAGEIKDSKEIRSYIRNDDYIVCADGGLKHAEKMNLKINLTVGDFDSSDEPENAQIIKLPVEKDITDTFACMEKCIEKGYRDFLLLGCTGGRLDHFYANVLLLKYAFDNDCNAVIVNENNRISIISENETRIKYDGYENVSFFAFMGEIENLTIENAKYNLSSHNLAQSDPLCISNSFVNKGDIIIKKDSGLLLVIESN